MGFFEQAFHLAVASAAQEGHQGGVLLSPDYRSAFLAAVTGAAPASPDQVAQLTSGRAQAMAHAGALPQPGSLNPSKGESLVGLVTDSIAAQFQATVMLGVLRLGDRLVGLPTGWDMLTPEAQVVIDFYKGVRQQQGLTFQRFSELPPPTQNVVKQVMTYGLPPDQATATLHEIENRDPRGIGLAAFVRAAQLEHGERWQTEFATRNYQTVITQPHINSGKEEISQLLANLPSVILGLNLGDTNFHDFPKGLKGTITDVLGFGLSAGERTALIDDLTNGNPKGVDIILRTLQSTVTRRTQAATAAGQVQIWEEGMSGFITNTNGLTSKESRYARGFAAQIMQGVPLQEVAVNVQNTCGSDALMRIAEQYVSQIHALTTKSKMGELYASLIGREMPIADLGIKELLLAAIQNGGWLDTVLPAIFMKAEDGKRHVALGLTSDMAGQATMVVRRGGPVSGLQKIPAFRVMWQQSNAQQVASLRNKGRLGQVESGMLIVTSAFGAGSELYTIKLPVLVKEVDRVEGEPSPEGGAGPVSLAVAALTMVRQLFQQAQSTMYLAEPQQIIDEALRTASDFCTAGIARPAAVLSEAMRIATNYQKTLAAMGIALPPAPAPGAAPGPAPAPGGPAVPPAVAAAIPIGPPAPPPPFTSELLLSIFGQTAPVVPQVAGHEVAAGADAAAIVANPVERLLRDLAARSPRVQRFLWGATVDEAAVESGVPVVPTDSATAGDRGLQAWTRTIGVAAHRVYEGLAGAVVPDVSLTFADDTLAAAPPVVAAIPTPPASSPKAPPVPDIVLRLPGQIDLAREVGISPFVAQVQNGAQAEGFRAGASGQGRQNLINHDQHEGYGWGKQHAALLRQSSVGQL